MAALEHQDPSMAVNDALVERLMEMTPPLDPEEGLREARILEAEAREALEADGCPPCYPPEMDISIEPPPKYRRIVNYWKSLVNTDGVVLCAQREDWQNFRRIQARDRIHFAKHFDEYTAKVHARLSSHGINEQPNLRLNPKDQSVRDTWIEFQHFQIRHLEELTKERDALIEKLGSARVTSAPKILRADMTPNQMNNFDLGADEKEIKGQTVFLEWIAETLSTMRQDTDERDKPDVSRRRVSARLQPKRQSARVESNEASSTSKQTANASRKRKVSTLDAVIDAETGPPTKVRAAKGFPTSSAPSRQIKTPSKAKPATSKSKGRKAQPEAAQPIVTTRCGRISRPPVRYTP